MWATMVLIFYTTYISVDLTLHMARYFVLKLVRVNVKECDLIQTNHLKMILFSAMVLISLYALEVFTTGAC